MNRQGGRKIEESMKISFPQHITRRRMGKISNGVGGQDRSNLEPSKLHGEILGRDKAIWDAVHNEGGIEPTHHA